MSNLGFNMSPPAKPKSRVKSRGTRGAGGTAAAPEAGAGAAAGATEAAPHWTSGPMSDTALTDAPQAPAEAPRYRGADDPDSGNYGSGGSGGSGSGGFGGSGGDAAKRRTIGIVVAAVLGVTLIASVVGFAALKFTSGPSGDDFTGAGTGTVTVVVKPGDSLTSMGQELTSKGVTASTQGFVNAAKGNPNATKIQPGTYTLREQMSAAAALELLADPASKVVIKVTVPEGSRLDAVVTAAAKATGLPESDFREALAKPDELGLPAYAKGQAEGFLYPATYDAQPGVTATQILKQMVAKFNEVSSAINLEDRAKRNGQEPYDVVITASLVEGEGTPEDFGKIARVVQNREDQNMPLQFDSTSNYASKASNIQLTSDQKNADTPYNTYKYKGLPPTPIGQPGTAAMEAALEPEPGDWLYFVATDPAKKITKFTSNYKTFLGYSDELQRYLRENPAPKASSSQ